MALREKIDSPVIDYKTHFKGQSYEKENPHRHTHTMRESDVSKERVSAPVHDNGPVYREVKKYKLRIPVRPKHQHGKGKASAGAPPVDVLGLLGFSGPAVGEVGEVVGVIVLTFDLAVLLPFKKGTTNRGGQ